MPQSAPSRHPIQSGTSYAPVANQVTTQLNASGDSSACEFADWHTHTQVLNAMYKRVYVYDTNPTPSTAGIFSGAPAVSYSYLDINYTLQVVEEKESASYCSGLYQPQQLVMYSDSSSGGFGQSGTITTSAVGYARRKWVKATDVESNCQQNQNSVLARLPGQYNRTFDTSANTGSHFADLLMQCESTCNTFNQNLVDY